MSPVEAHLHPSVGGRGFSSRLTDEMNRWLAHCSHVRHCSNQISTAAMSLRRCGQGRCYVFYMDSSAANKAKLSCIHFKSRYLFATEIQLSNFSDEVNPPTSFYRTEQVTQLFR